VRADAILNLAFERTNGDVMNADYPTGYSPLTRGGLWARDDLPDSWTGSALDQIENIHARAALVRSVFPQFGLDAGTGAFNRDPGCAEF